MRDQDDIAALLREVLAELRASRVTTAYGFARNAVLTIGPQLDDGPHSAGLRLDFLFQEILRPPIQPARLPAADVDERQTYVGMDPFTTTDAVVRTTAADTDRLIAAMDEMKREVTLLRAEQAECLAGQVRHDPLSAGARSLADAPADGDGRLFRAAISLILAALEAASPLAIPAAAPPPAGSPR